MLHEEHGKLAMMHLKACIHNISLVPSIWDSHLLWLCKRLVLTLTRLRIISTPFSF